MRFVNMTRETRMETMDADSKTIISNIPSTRKERNYLPKYLCLVVLSWHLPLLLSGGQKALDWQSWSEGNTFHLKYQKTYFKLWISDYSRLILAVCNAIIKHFASQKKWDFWYIWWDLGWYWGHHWVLSPLGWNKLKLLPDI